MSKLLLSQKNAVLDLLTRNDFSPNEFEFFEIRSSYSEEAINKLRHKRSKYFFEFDNSSKGTRRANYSPGDQDETVIYEATNWIDQLSFVGDWLNYLKREIQEPDKWKQVFEDQDFFKAKHVDEENDKFTFKEVEQIEGGIKKLKAALPSLNLSGDKVEEISNKLDHLTEQSKILGRIDWKSLAVGYFINIAHDIVTNYSKETAQLFVAAVKVSFKIILLLT